VTTTWHADPALIASYAADDLDDVRASSLEAHLLSCERCRHILASAAPREPSDATWRGIERELDAPHTGLVEQCLLRLGVREHVARLLAATPSLQLSWFLAEALALGSAAVAATRSVGTDMAVPTLFVFLVLAALAPVAGVAAAFGPGIDPAYEVGVAAPMRGDRLLFIRAAAVLSTSLAIASVAALALPGFDRSVALWLLPALGLTLATLALAAWMRPIVAACAVGLAWLLIAALGSVATADPLAAFHLIAQLTYAAAIVGSSLVLIRRHAATEGRIPS
jgi:putative zinc finger protein